MPPSRFPALELLGVRSTVRERCGLGAGECSKPCDTCCQVSDLPLSTYELERATRIKDNNKVLAALDPAQLEASRSTPKGAARVVKRERAAADTSQEVRRSTRAKADVDYTAEKVEPLQTWSSASAVRSSTPAVVEVPVVQAAKRPLPSVSNGSLHFADFPDFRPNLTPKQVFQLGSFGGTYFRPITSSVTCMHYPATQHEEFPQDWFSGLSIAKQVASPVYRESVNRYGVKSGTDLLAWEASGWIRPCDPYGWFQWYCRFYQGRRSSDDARQVGRWLALCGPNGRFRISLINKIYRAGGAARVNDASVSPVIRQTLQHWGYELSAPDYEKRIRAKKPP